MDVKVVLFDTNDFLYKVMNVKAEDRLDAVIYGMCCCETIAFGDEYTIMDVNVDIDGEMYADYYMGWVESLEEDLGEGHSITEAIDYIKKIWNVVDAGMEGFDMMVTTGNTVIFSTI